MCSTVKAALLTSAAATVQSAPTIEQLVKIQVNRQKILSIAHPDHLDLSAALNFLSLSRCSMMDAQRTALK